MAILMILLIDLPTCGNSAQVIPMWLPPSGDCAKSTNQVASLWRRASAAWACRSGGARLRWLGCWTATRNNVGTRSLPSNARMGAAQSHRNRPASSCSSSAAQPHWESSRITPVPTVTPPGAPFLPVPSARSERVAQSVNADMALIAAPGLPRVIRAPIEGPGRSLRSYRTCQMFDGRGHPLPDPARTWVILIHVVGLP